MPETELAQQYVTAEQLVRITGATFRQIYYWRFIGLLTSDRVSVRGVNRERLYDPVQIQRARLIYRLSCMDFAVKGRTFRPLIGLPDKVFDMRYLLFSAPPKLRLRAATNNKLEMLRLAAAERGAVVLVELEEIPKEEDVIGKRVTYTLSSETVRLLEALAAKSDCSPAAVIEELVREGAYVLAPERVRGRPRTAAAGGA